LKKNVVFGRWEGISMLLIVICTQIFVNMPRVAAEEAGTAGWILVLYVSLLSIGIFGLITVLYRRFEGKDLLDIAQETFGPAGRITLGIILVLFILFIASLVLREFSENIKIISLNMSPISYVAFFFAVSMAIGAYMGIEAIVRVAAIAVPVIILGYILIAVGVTQYVEISKITPLLGAGPYRIFVKGISRMSLYAGIILVFFIPPFLKTNKNLRFVGYVSLWMSTVFMTLSTLVYLLVYQFPASIENFLPMYQLARLIKYGRFFERIESVFMVIWGMTAFLYLSITFFFIVYIFHKSMGLKYYRPLVLPFAILLYTLSLIPENLVTAIRFETATCIFPLNCLPLVIS